MTDMTYCDRELLQLPDKIYEARLAELEIEQRLLTAETRYQNLRARQYLAYCAAGRGHYQAQSSTACTPEVMQARDDRDELAVELKRASARHYQLRDHLSVELSLANRQTAADPGDCC